MTDGAITGTDIHRIVALGKSLLEHPVELLPGIRAAVEAVAAKRRVVLIHQGRPVPSGAQGRAVRPRRPVRANRDVSEKDARSYARVIGECDTAAQAFAMIGNSLRSDIEPVIGLGGWGIHMPYHVTWAHELEHGVDNAPSARDHDRLARGNRRRGCALRLTLRRRASPRSWRRKRSRSATGHRHRASSSVRGSGCSRLQGPDDDLRGARPKRSR